MANNYQEFNYYKKMFDGEIKELKDQRDEIKKEDEVDAEIREIQDAECKKGKEFLAGTEEDWKEEEVDLKELQKRIKKE